MPDLLATLALLFALELILGVDNIVLTSILLSRLPKEPRKKALIARLVMVAGASCILEIVHPALFNLSIRDLILLCGCGFLIWKTIREIHHTIELLEADAIDPPTVSPNSASCAI